MPKKKPSKKDPAAVALARRRAKTMTPEQRKASARKAALARWKKSDAGLPP